MWSGWGPSRCVVDFYMRQCWPDRRVGRGDDVTVSDLVAAPDRQTEPLKTLAHVEFQLRVLGLLCAAAAQGRTKLTTPGSLDVWSKYIRLNRSALRCDTCEVAALDVAESVDAEVALDTSVRQMRNQVFHGGPDPENVDLDALHGVLSTIAEKIVEIYAHKHVSRLEPFFIEIDGELAALNDYSEGSATYWPRRAPATRPATRARRPPGAGAAGQRPPVGELRPGHPEGPSRIRPA